MEDALKKLRSAYGLNDTADLDDGSNHDETDDDWQNTHPPLPPLSIYPAPVIGKPVAGRYAHAGATHSPYPVGAEEKNIVSVEDLNLPTEGTLLGRLSVRSLVTKDWSRIFWVLSSNHHRRPLHLDEDPLSLLIYRSRQGHTRINFTFQQRGL